MVEIGDKLPDARVVDTELKVSSIAELSRGRAAVFAFFPGAFTGVCTKEMCTLRDLLSKFNSMNASVYGISVDGPFANKEFKGKNGINFTILSDYRKEAIRNFGVEMPNFARVEGYVAAKRSVFVVDRNGVIRYKWVSDDPTVEPNYAEVEAAIASIK